MGGEKLKVFKPFIGIILLFVFFSHPNFGTVALLNAQESDAVPPLSTPISGSTAIDESTIILGETPVAPIPESESSIWVLFRMIIVLALAALAIYGVVFFVKRLAKTPESLDPHLRVLAKVPLAADSFAAVVSVGAKAWLVGGGSGGINLISEIEDTEVLETMLIEDADKIAQAENRKFFSFASIISRIGRQGGKNLPGDTGIDANMRAENLRKQRQRLRDS